MEIVLFDNEYRQRLFPLTATRAVADLRMGIFTVKERWQHIAGNADVYIDTTDYLQSLYKPIPNGVHTFIDAAIIATPSLIQQIQHLQQGEVLEDEVGIIAINAFGKTYKEAIDNAATLFIAAKETAQRIRYPHDIFLLNKQVIEFDFKLVTAGKISQQISDTNRIINPKNVFIAEGATVEYAIINAEEGPVYIGKNALVMEGTLIRGPFVLGERAVVKMGAKIYGATSIGKQCTAGGEIKNIVMQDYSNKAHDGYLGDAVIGQWCNFGAGTSNSNIKNSAGDVQQWNNYENNYVNAGLKCGVVMGDYSRVAINSSINTGSYIGVCCNVFGDGLMPKKIADFCWGYSNKYELDKALVHIHQWKNLKQQNITAEEKDILKHIFEQL